MNEGRTRKIDRLKVALHVVGILMTALAVTSIIMGVVVGNRQERAIECQSRINAQFLDALKTNAALFQADRDNNDRFFVEVFSSTSREESFAAFHAYQDRRKKIDDQRKSYPPLPTKVCTAD